MRLWTSNLGFFSYVIGRVLRTPSQIPMRRAKSFDGRKDVIQALGRMCTDHNIHSRHKALNLLVAIAEKSDPDVLAAVLGVILQGSDDVPLYARLAALSAVPAVVKIGDPWAIRPLLGELETSDPSVRRMAILSLRKITPKGNADVVRELLKRLSQDDDLSVRFSVIEALVQIGCNRDHQLIEVLCDTLLKEEEGSGIRLALMKAIVVLAPPGCKRSISTALALIHDKDVNLRLFVVEAIGGLCERGDFVSYSALMSKLNYARTDEVLRCSKQKDQFAAFSHSLGSQSPEENSKRVVPSLEQDKHIKAAPLHRGASLLGEQFELTEAVSPDKSGSSSGNISRELSALGEEDADAQEEWGEQDVNSIYDAIGRVVIQDGLSRMNRSHIKVSFPHNVSDGGKDGEIVLSSPSPPLSAQGDMPRTSSGHLMAVVKWGEVPTLPKTASDQLIQTDIAIEGGTLIEGEEMSGNEGDTKEVEAGLEISYLPITPPYTPNLMRPSSVHRGPETPPPSQFVHRSLALQFGKFELALPIPSQLHSAISLSSPLASGKQRTSVTAFVGSPGVSYHRTSPPSTLFSGTKKRTTSRQVNTHKPLPLSLPSDSSLRLSRARSKAWLCPPKSRDLLHTGSPLNQGSKTQRAHFIITKSSCSALLLGGTANHLCNKVMPDEESRFESGSPRKTSAFSGSFRKKRSPRRESSKLTPHNMEPNVGVRLAVIKSLSLIGSHGDLDLIEVLSERFHDSDKQVCVQAVQAITLLIVPVINGPIDVGPEDPEHSSATKRINEIIASFRSKLLEMIPDRNGKTRAAALEGLRLIAKPGDVTCLNMLVKNVFQLKHYETVTVLKKIATRTAYKTVMDCLLFVIRKHEEKLCPDENTSRMYLKFYVDYLKIVAGPGNREAILKLVQITKEANLCKSAKQACMIAANGIVSKQDRQIVMHTLVGSGAVKDLETAFHGHDRTLTPALQASE